METTYFNNKKNKTKRVLLTLASIVFWLAIWQIGSMAIKNELILPSFFQTAHRIVALGVTVSFWQTVARSLLRISLGFVFGVLFGTLGGIFCGYVSFLRTLFSPILTIVRSAPVASFIMLAYVWISKTALPGFISFLMVFPIVWTSVERGVLQRDKGLLESAKIFKFNQKKVLKYITIPSVYPFFLSSISTSLGLAWKAGIAAEVLVYAKNTIGGMLYNSKVSFETTDVFAWTTVVVIISLILEFAIKAIFEKTGKAATK